LQTKIIAACHSSALGGHSGIAATYSRMKKHFAWKGMKMDVENFVKQCSIYQHAKHSLQHPMGLLQPLPIPAGVWQDLTMDFIEGLPKSEGYSVVLVMVDRLTKYSHFLPIRHPYTALTVAQTFLDTVWLSYMDCQLLLSQIEILSLSVISGRNCSSCIE